jgi:hypothetical protein
MTGVVVILALASGSLQGAGAKRVSDRERGGFVGPVKEVFTEWSPAGPTRNGIQPGTRCPQQSSLFDAHGRLAQHAVYAGACGCQEIRDLYADAPDGSQTAKREKLAGKGCPPSPPSPPSPPGAPESGPQRRVFTYDEHGRQAEATLLRHDGTVVYKTVYGYDAKGRVTEIARFDGNGQAGDRRVYSSTGEFRVPATFTYDGRDGRVFDRTAYSDYAFNAQGDWVKRTQTRVDERGETHVSTVFRKIVSHTRYADALRPCLRRRVLSAARRRVGFSPTAERRLPNRISSDEGVASCRCRPKSKTASLRRRLASLGQPSQRACSA